MTDINKGRVLATFLELVRIDAPTGREEALAAHCARELEALGCTVRFDNSAAVTGSNTGNLIAVLPANAPATPGAGALPLYFSAHLDSVNPCLGIQPRVEDGVIYSDGTTVLGGDDKVGVAALLEALRVLKETGEPHAELRILLSTMEEVGLVGAKAMDAAEFAHTQGALCYVLDAGGAPGVVVNGAPYQHSYEARFIGKAAHAGIAPETGVNAIHAAAGALAQLPQGRLDEQTTANVGTITGGSANNIVPELCIVTGEIRSHNQERLLALRAEVEGILRAAAGVGAHLPAPGAAGATANAPAPGAATVEISWEVNYDGFFAAESSAQVQLALRAAASLGLDARTEISGGGADTNILASRGLAAVSLGTGMDRVHTTSERLAVQDLENLAALTLALVRLY